MLASEFAEQARLKGLSRGLVEMLEACRAQKVYLQRLGARWQSLLGEEKDLYYTVQLQPALQRYTANMNAARQRLKEESRGPAARLAAWLRRQPLHGWMARLVSYLAARLAAWGGEEQEGGALSADELRSPLLGDTAR